MIGGPIEDTQIAKSNSSGYKATYSLCTSLYNMSFAEIKLNDLQRVVDESGKNAPTLKKLKSLLGQLFEYAIIHEIIPKERDMTQYVDIKKAGNPNALVRKPFTRKEIENLWSAVIGNEYVSIVLMLIYSGARIGELLDLKKESVHLSERWFQVTASKTKAGIRMVPINEKIALFFENWMKKSECEYVICTPYGKKLDYRNYLKVYWEPLLGSMNIKRLPHDARHTCVSLLATAGVDSRIIKKIVGHKGQTVTEIVYTHFQIEELLGAVNRI